MREIDRLTTERFAVPSLVLMENAAAATARVIAGSVSGEIRDKSVQVFCGTGNNGGDGAAAARLLAHAGARVQVFLFGAIEQTRGDARTNFEALSGSLDHPTSGSVRLNTCATEGDCRKIVDDWLAEPPDVIVDALFGTGLTRPLSGIHQQIVTEINRMREEGGECLLVSIDIPSGLNSDKPEIIGPTIKSDITVTMTAPKTANVLPPATTYNGRLIVADIGSPRELIDSAKTNLFLSEEENARRWLLQTRYTPDSYKNTHGHAVVVAGSRGFTGAAALCANAAMRAGAGLVTVATPASAQPLVATQVLCEVMTTALAETDRGAVSEEAFEYFAKFIERADVVAIGPGLSSEDERTRNFVRTVVEKRVTPIVVDADGLNCLSPWPSDLRGSAEYPIVLTPHPGEMLRLIGGAKDSVLDDRVAVARNFATRHEVILLLKGSRSIIAAPDGRVFVNSTGNAGLGTAGAGDTLTGVITGFVAQAFSRRKSDVKPASAIETTIAALYISGLAGDLAARDRGMRCMIASDIREHLSAAVCLLDPAGEKP